MLFCILHLSLLLSLLSPLSSLLSALPPSLSLSLSMCVRARALTSLERYRGSRHGHSMLHTMLIHGEAPMHTLSSTQPGCERELIPCWCPSAMPMECISAFDLYMRSFALREPTICLAKIFALFTSFLFAHNLHSWITFRSSLSMSVNSKKSKKQLD